MNDGQHEGPQGIRRREEAGVRQGRRYQPRRGGQLGHHGQPGLGRARVGGGQDNESPQGRPKFGWRKLQMLRNEVPDDILMILSNKKKEFGDLLTGPLKPDWINLILEIISKACRCQMSHQTLVHFLDIIQATDFVDLQLPNHLMAMTKERSVHRQEQFAQPIKDTINMCEQLLLKIPSQAYDKVFICLSLLDTVVKMLRAKTNIIDDEIDENLKRICELRDECAKRVKSDRPNDRRNPPVANMDDETPPEDFRRISIIPQPRDLEIDNRPFLRANKCHGRYADVDHYLDVQFRLLREDFIQPLREGLEEYKRRYVEIDSRKSRLQNVRVYKDVVVVKPVCTSNGLNYRIRLDKDQCKKIRWKFTKRLIYGSLVCLSRDGFQTLLFATVVDRDHKVLGETGELEVRFEEFTMDVAESIRNFDYKYTVLETNAFFEAYRHTLKGLQDTTRENMPFKKYVVECENDVDPPLYLRGNTQLYDLRPVLRKGVEKEQSTSGIGSDAYFDLERNVGTRSLYKFTAAAQFARRVNILDLPSWPSAEELGLDNSQLKALQTCLTKEFSVIQGPPGTGKTFIGLKVMEVLLHNKDIWKVDPLTRERDPRPILVVCYTNHALDQFLEGIIEFCSERVLRIGGRSKSEALQKFNLKNFREKIREKKLVPRAVLDGLRAAREDMRQLQTDIEGRVKETEVVEKGIIHEDVLHRYMSEQHYFELTSIVFERSFDRKPGLCIMAEWLGYGKSILSEFVDDENQEEMDGNVAADENDEDENEDDEIVVEDEVDFIELQRVIDDLDEEVIIHTNKRRGNEVFDVLGLDASKLEDKTDTSADGFQVFTGRKKSRRHRLLRQLRSRNVMSAEEANQVGPLWKLDHQTRWRLYRFWIMKFLNDVNADIERNQQLYVYAAQRMKEARDQEDLVMMRCATVIGMTTTGAARYRNILQEVRPRIIVVEEAAEVLESHIIATLSEGCQHLILIGDHKQLRPSPSVYTLAKNYNLEISLFERMVMNSMKVDCLQQQHRMRPEISSLVRFIYPDLVDHESVLSYSSIPGVCSNVYFISHRYAEQTDPDMKSHSNRHEALFLAGLCKYFLLQGIEASKITILTPYTGQLFMFKDRRIMSKQFFGGVKVTVVDNYQGEENDIILLSLVRSNPDGKLGFLNIENRVCVALSRAKKGFYVIGNFEMLVQKSELWSKLVRHLKQVQCIGKSLTLMCQNHPETYTEVQDAADFSKTPEGGCQKLCEFRLPCGHQCGLVCHILDSQHEEVKCRKRCSKLCPNGHNCGNYCWQDCGPCHVRVERRIPECGHLQHMMCHQTAVMSLCMSPCTSFLSCGHPCTNRCGEAHTSVCNVLVEKKWPCGCSNMTACSVNENVEPCPNKCAKVLLCGHSCSGTCSECLCGRLHTRCSQKCDRTLVCGHACKFPCTKNCPPCQQPCENQCVHSKCPSLCGDPCPPCTEPCSWVCPHYQCSNLCHEDCDRPRCDQPCNKELRCGHACIGLCGETCPTLCRICDKDTVTMIFFGHEDEDDARFIQLDDCDHVVEVRGMDEWMATNSDGDIQLKRCPICRVSIRKHLRYGNIVKQTLRDIESVKRKVIGMDKTIRSKQQELEQQLRDFRLTNNAYLPSYPVNVNSLKEEIRNKRSTSDSLILFENKLKFLTHILKIQKDIDKQPNFRTVAAALKQDIKKIVPRLMSLATCASEQQLHDFQWEITRISRVVDFGKYDKVIKDRNLAASGRIPGPIMRHFKECLERLNDKRIPHDEGQDERMSKVLKALKDHIPSSGLGISEEERVEIVRALNLTAGHWYKCKNGHIYAIGDCGQPNQTSTCPDCGTNIGGQRILQSGNVRATEMESHALPTGRGAANIDYPGY